MSDIVVIISRLLECLPFAVKERLQRLDSDDDFLWKVSLKSIEAMMFIDDLIARCMNFIGIFCVLWPMRLQTDGRVFSFQTQLVYLEFPSTSTLCTTRAITSRSTILIRDYLTSLTSVACDEKALTEQ